jgi:hypothetical protein
VFVERFLAPSASTLGALLLLPELAGILSSRTFELQAAEASPAPSAPVREPGRILGTRKDLFKLT